MTKKKVLVLFVLVLAIGGWFFFNSKPGTTAFKGPEPGADSVAGSGIEPSASTPGAGAAVVSGPQGARDVMSIQGMEISQGEAGKKLWHLTADSASMREEGGVIFVDNPFLTYFMEGKERPLTVDSKSGDVDQSNNNIRFLGNVIAKQDDSILRTDMLEYIGAQRKLLSPGAARFSATNLLGSADTAEWDLNTNIMTATGNVHTEMEMNARAPRGRDSDRSQ